MAIASPAGRRAAVTQAQYEKLYRIVYHANGGLDDSVPVMAQSFAVQPGASVTKVLETEPVPQYDAACSKKFCWWSAAADSSARIDSVTVGYDTDSYPLDGSDEYYRIDVYAVWQDPCTVSYAITGSTLADHAVPPSQSVFPGDSFHVAAALAEPGYDFSGWHYGGQVYADEDYSPMPGGNVTFTGSFSEHTYTLNYRDSDRTSLPQDSNGSTDLYQPKTVSYTKFMENVTGSEPGGVLLTAPNPVKAGHRFLGWAVAPAYTAVKYAEGDKVTDFAADRTATVYAVWEEKSITLTYLAPEATMGRVPNPVSQTGVDALVGKTAVNDPTEPLVRANYTFHGWNLVQDAYPIADAATHYDVNSDYSFTENTTLYAEWEPIVYVHLNYDANGGCHADGDDVRTALPTEEIGENFLRTTIKSPSDKLVNTPCSMRSGRRFRCGMSPIRWRIPTSIRIPRCIRRTSPRITRTITKGLSSMSRRICRWTATPLPAGAMTTSTIPKTAPSICRITM